MDQLGKVSDRLLHALMILVAAGHRPKPQR